MSDHSHSDVKTDGTDSDLVVDPVCGMSVDPHAT